MSPEFNTTLARTLNILVFPRLRNFQTLEHEALGNEDKLLFEPR